jgi:hypothetical protein
MFRYKEQCLRVKKSSSQLCESQIFIQFSILMSVVQFAKISYFWAFSCSLSLRTESYLYRVEETSVELENEMV